ncbi:alpha/beta fold hydrolase [Paraburkholderia fynbosensis]|uniref:Pyrethroid hydrolase n=1 Tax=Paraburkholderia fynbosensis TaxID=1200993 RepID=A0A6J5GZR9_9BURK|nr:alpha/beta fold hydrolase [Paraburkholderia fynbosensis]CAB3810023.1 Pyrethroid hydrolase [Paraburkholderia fynbosensis]
MKRTIVLIHGSWHWGGCFQKVATLLAAQGHPVLCPDLKSHGLDPARYEQVTDMTDYTAAVSALLDNAAEPVVLLGHSMGGVALTHLGEQYPDKISKLVYLTAFMTPRDKSANDYLLSDGYRNDPSVAKLFDIVMPSADGKGVSLNVEALATVRSSFYGDCSDRDVAVAAANVVPTNTAVPYHARTETTQERFGSIPRVFIECTQDFALPIDQQRRMQADVPGAKVVTMNTSHSPFFSQPERLAEIIGAEAG